MTRRNVNLFLLSWLSMLGADFFLHGGLLASFYLGEGPFLLPPLEAFRLIPLGYLGFALLAVLLLWLMEGLVVRGLWRGFRFGLALGGLTWGALVLGLISISTIPLSLALAWWIGQSVELAVAGAVLGYALAQEELNSKKLWGRVLLGILVLIVLTIVLQSAGLAPAVIIN